MDIGKISKHKTRYSNYRENNTDESMISDPPTESFTGFHNGSVDVPGSYWMPEPLERGLSANQAPGFYVQTIFPNSVGKEFEIDYDTKYLVEFEPSQSDSLVIDEGFLEDHVSGSNIFANYVSCNGNAIETNHGITRQQCNQSSSIDPKRAKWTDNDDRFLIKLVKQYGEKNWLPISMQFAEKSGKQCRERWFNVLHPDIKKEPWNQEEDAMLIRAHRKYGNNWVDISKYIPGRPGNNIKNRFNSVKRKLNSKRSNNGRNSGTRNENTLLEQYIISIDAHNNTKDKLLARSRDPQKVLARSRDPLFATSEEESVQVQQKSSPRELTGLQNSLGVQSYNTIVGSVPHYNYSMISDAEFGANEYPNNYQYPDNYDQFSYKWQSAPTINFNAVKGYGYKGIDSINISHQSISEKFQSSSFDVKDNSAFMVNCSSAADEATHLARCRKRNS